MKSKITQRRYRAPKKSSCGLCKPQKRGWDDKKTLKAAEPTFEFWNNPEDAIYDQL